MSENQNQNEILEQPIENEPKTIMDELLEIVLAETGKTRAEFEADVENARQQSNPEIMANIVSMLMMNAEGMAEMLCTVMMDNMQLKADIEALKGGMK